MKTTIQIENVLSVYSGKDGKCCCGCAGKHFYAAAHRDEASKDRGYEVDANEISDKMVRKVVKILNEATDVERNSDKCISTVVGGDGGRLYIVYLRQPIAKEAK